MADAVTVHLRFVVETSLGTFQDTLVFSEADWAKRDQNAIIAAKQSLADAWVEFRTAQIVEEEVMRTRKGKEAKIAEIDARIADLAASKDGIQAELSKG